MKQVGELSALELRVEIAERLGAHWYAYGSELAYLSFTRAELPVVQRPENWERFGVGLTIPDWPNNIEAAKKLITLLIVQHRLKFEVTTLVPSSDVPVIFVVFRQPDGAEFSGDECLLEPNYFEMAISRAALRALRALEKQDNAN